MRSTASKKINLSPARSLDPSYVRVFVQALSNKASPSYVRAVLEFGLDSADLEGKRKPKRKFSSVPDQTNKEHLLSYVREAVLEVGFDHAGLEH